MGSPSRVRIRIAAVIGILIAIAPAAHAELTRVEITSRVDVLNGKAFGNVGPYEKLRGKPAPEQLRLAATFVGVALIVSLMVFVTYLDIKRF